MIEFDKAHARIAELEAELAAIGAGGVSGPLMGEQSAPKVSDAQRALHELILNRLSHAELLEKAHYLMELNSNQGRTIGELQDLVALTAQAPSQPGGFSAGDMASAAAQGYRDGWTAAQAISAEPAVQDVCEWHFDDEYEVVWESSCGELWSFIDGGPAENSVRFCQGCGKPVAMAAHEKAKKP